MGRNSLACFIAIGLLFPLGLAHAEDMDPLIVDASLTSRHLSQTGSSVTILTREEIARAGQPFLLDVLRALPGLSLSQTGPLGGVANIRIRGGESDHTLVLINGVKFNDPTSRAFDFAHLLASDVERVEIIKGAQSVVHGADALAGVISITTRKNEESQYLRGQIEGGSFDSFLRSGGITFRENMHRLDMGGSFYSSENIDISRGAGVDEKDSYSRFNLNARYQGRYEGAWADYRLNMWARHMQAESEGDNTDNVNGETLVSDGARNDETRYQERGFGGAMRAEAKMGFFLFESAFLGSYYASDRKTWTNPAGGFIMPFTQTLTSRYDVRWENSWLHEKGSFSFLFGREEESFLQTHRSGREEEHEKIFVASELVLLPVQDLTASAGMRYEDNDAFQSSTTWRATLAYIKTIENASLRFHTGYGTAVQNPTLYDLYGFLGSGFTPNPSLEAEKGESFDIGLELSFPASAFTMGITYFSGTLENEIMLDFFTRADMTLSSTPRNQKGKSDRQGVELAASLHPYENLGLGLNYSFIASENPRGEDELRRPEHLIQLWADWRLAKRWKVNMNLNHTGKQKDAVFQAVSPFARRVVTLGAVTLLSMQITYEVKPRANLYLRFENISNEKRSDVYGYARRGFGVYVGLRGEF